MRVPRPFPGYRCGTEGTGPFPETVKWIPRTQLVDVDALSRTVDHDDWDTTDTLFAILNTRWGPFHRDCFADTKNTRSATFFSKYMCPNSSGVNAFLYSWERGINYLVPPVSLVGKTIKHLRFYKGKGVLVVPYWVSAHFWVYLCDPEQKFKKFIKDYLLFDDPRYCVKQGLNENCFIGSNSFRSKILAMFLDFS